MMRFDLSFIQRSRFFKYIGYAVFTIILGALGSGLWERFLSPGLEQASNYSLFAISYIYRGYLDVLHRDIGRADINQIILLPYFILLLFMVLGPWMVIHYYYKQYRKMGKKLKFIRSIDDKVDDEIIVSSELSKKIDSFEKLYKSLKPMLQALVIITIIFTIMTIITINKDNYTRNACIFIERSIDIVAPYLDSQEVVKLKAEYRSINNANKFYSLESKLKRIAAAKDVQLPQFTIIR